MDSFTAVSIAEGICGGKDATEEQQIEAWQYLINTGLAFQLQGSFGRQAVHLIESGICTPPRSPEETIDRKHGHTARLIAD